MPTATAPSAGTTAETPHDPIAAPNQTPTTTPHVINPVALFTALSVFVCHLHVCAIGTAAWIATACEATALLGRPAGRATQAAVTAGLRAARHAADGPLPRGSRKAIEPLLRALAIHVRENGLANSEPIEALARDFVHTHAGGALVHARSSAFRAEAENTHDASVLGWGAGYWPTSETFQLADGRSATLTRVAAAVDSIGDIAYVTYEGPDGVRVTVEND